MDRRHVPGQRCIDQGHLPPVEYPLRSGPYQTIAFATVGHHALVGLYRFDTKAVQEVALVYEGDARDLHWSPDSRFLAYETIPASGYHQLKVYDLQQGEHLALGVNLQEQPVQTYFVRWAPHGWQLTFMVHEVRTGRWVTKQMDPPWSRQWHK